MYEQREWNRQISTDIDILEYNNIETKSVLDWEVLPTCDSFRSNAIKKDVHCINIG